MHSRGAGGRVMLLARTSPGCVWLALGRLRAHGDRWTDAHGVRHALLRVMAADRPRRLEIRAKLTPR